MTVFRFLIGENSVFGIKYKCIILTLVQSVLWSDVNKCSKCKSIICRFFVLVAYMYNSYIIDMQFYFHFESKRIYVYKYLSI